MIFNHIHCSKKICHLGICSTMCVCTIHILCTRNGTRKKEELKLTDVIFQGLVFQCNKLFGLTAHGQCYK